MTNGRTRPLVIVCDKPDQDETEETEWFNEIELPISMVVKGIGLPEVREMSLFSELFGNLLAREFGISTPVPALVNLPNEFVSIANEVLKTYKIEIQPGVGVGCELLNPFSPIIEKGFLKDDELEQAAMIYAYDLVVQNPDRLFNRPNCATHKGVITAFDFEMAFSFLLPIISRNPAWEVSKHGISEKHFLDMH
jgi:hypothetical protein